MRSSNLQTTTGAVPKRGDRLRRLAALTVLVLGWTYLFFALALWGVMHLLGEHRWFTTLLIYGPRWVWATPLALLIPAAALLRRRSLWPLLFATYVMVWPIMDLRLPWRRAMPDRNSGVRIRVLSCNTHGDAMDVDAMAALIARLNPDVVALEEFTGGNARRLFPDARWHFCNGGDQWIASRFEFADTPFPFPTSPQRVAFFAGRVQLITPGGPVDFYSIHLASPHSVFSAALRAKSGSRQMVARNVHQRLEEATQLADDADSKKEAVLMAGDFNLPTDSAIYRQNFSEFADAFSVAGFGFGWTYRVRWTVTRIDHVLSNASLRCVNCWVAPNVSSPHRPLVADYVWSSPKSPLLNQNPS